VCRTSPRSAADSPHIVNASATWSDPRDDPIYIDWARRTYTALGRVGTDSGYLKFLGDE
jgi:hypothetical protein